MDQEGFGKFTGKTLLDLHKAATTLNVRVWDEFYTESSQQDSDDHVQRRSLPFPHLADLCGGGRVRGAAQKLVDFVCAAGILAHYIGDACQPLHTSQLFDGPPGGAQRRPLPRSTTML